MDVDRRLREFHGAARFKDLVANTTEARILERAVGSGTVLRHVHGVYALPNADLAVVAARVCRGRITAKTAVGLIPGCDVDDRDVFHVEVPRNCSAPRTRRVNGTRIVVHRHVFGIHPDPADEPVVPLSRAVAQMFRGPELVDAVIAADALLTRGLVTRGDLRAELSSRERRFVAWALDHVSERVASPLETTARLILAAAGFRSEANVEIAGVGFVDLLVEGRVVLELDGHSYHSDAIQFIADRQRDRRLHLLGYHVLRYASDELTWRSNSIAADVAGVLAREGPPPPPLRPEADLPWAP